MQQDEARVANANASGWLIDNTNLNILDNGNLAARRPLTLRTSSTLPMMGDRVALQLNGAGSSVKASTILVAR